MPLDLSILGQGIYSPRQAARLTRSTPQEVLRWTRGSGPSEPLWRAYYQSLNDTTELSFSDLIELRVVKSFRRVGISLQAIRFAIRFAEEKFEVDRPLSSLKFKTDGREILVEALERDGNYVSLSSARPGQKVFADIVEQSLQDLEYEDGEAVRWRPSHYKAVVLDPARQFGTPLLDKYGVSTSTIYEEFQSFQDKKYLARIYEVPVKIISKAIQFEQALENAKHD